MTAAATCPACAAETTAGARFCGACGHAVDAGPPPPRRRTHRASLANDVARDWQSVRGAIGLFGLLLLTMLPLAWMPATWAATGMLVIGVIDALVVGIAMRQMGGLVWSQFLRARIDASVWLLAIAGLAVALASNVIYHRTIITVLGVMPTPSLGEVFHDAGYGITITLLCTCLQPAIVEEFAFRGIIQGRLGSVVSRTEAILITAFAFGIMHMSVVSLPYLAAFGLFLGWLRQRSGSLVPGMVVHGVHNLVILTLGAA